ncbi:MAG: TrkH family potassium uptake protein [Planctomycetota bacterium]|nr:TrkH family potassium uptake protein [Planctomycetota bacterium]
MSVSSVFHVVGRLCLVYAGLLLLPLVVLLVDGDFLVGENVSPTGIGFFVASAISAALGATLVYSCSMHREEFDFEEGFAVVTFGWLAFMALGTIPYVWAGAIESLLDAMFETLSGLTTTGATILADPASIGRPLLFWRSLTHWVGGMGVVALAIAILPALGAGGNFLYRAEVSEAKSDRQFPRVADVAKLLWSIYVGLTVAEIVALRIAGMSWFDAVCHSFSTVATGGFGTRPDSLESFSPTIQWVVTVFMFLAGLNYVLLFRAVLGRPLALLKSTEARTWVGVLVTGMALGCVVLHSLNSAPEGLEPLFRSVAFTVVSISSTTGFSTTDFNFWPASLQVMLLLLMVGGACAGSTSGSAKMSRHLMWAKSAVRELKRLLRPTAIFVVKVEGRVVSDGIVQKSVAFLLFYIGAVCLGTLLLTLLGVAGEESLTSMISCLSGVGPGLGTVGPTGNYAAVPDGGKLVLMAVMLLGRLEFFAVLVLFSPLAWRR